MPMKHVFRTPQVEEGKHNVVLQDRCGNRLTAVLHDDSVELGFVYEPSAFGRKEFAARNAISLLNAGDEDLFAPTARNPLALAFGPHAGLALPA